MTKRHKIIVGTDNMQLVWWTFAMGYKNVKISKNKGQTWEDVPSMDTGKWGYNSNWLFQLNIPVFDFDFREQENILKLRNTIYNLDKLGCKIKIIKENKKLVEVQFKNYSEYTKSYNYITYFFKCTEDKDRYYLCCNREELDGSGEHGLESVWIEKEKYRMSLSDVEVSEYGDFLKHFEHVILKQKGR